MHNQEEPHALLSPKSCSKYNKELNVLKVLDLTQRLIQEATLPMEMMT